MARLWWVQVLGYTDSSVAGGAMGLRENDGLGAERGMSSGERAEEARLLRRLQMMMSMVMQTIAQDGSLSVEEASRMVADAKMAALAMFPGKELAYELIWRPRFQRLMRDRFRLM